MVVDPRLTLPLRLMIPEGSKTLKEHGVGAYVDLAWKDMTTECPSIFFLIAPDLELMAMVGSHLRSFAARGAGKEMLVAFMPHRSLACETALREEAGPDAEYRVEEYNADIVPYDDDLLCLELPKTFKTAFLDGDSTPLSYMAQALVKLQNMFGVIPHVKVKGDLAAQTVNMMRKLRNQAAAAGGARPALTSEIDTLFVIDRPVDLVTPLVTPLTYESLIDEILKIDHTWVQLDAAVFGETKTDAPAPPTPAAGAKAAPPKPKTIPVSLNANDKMYSELRHANIAVVSSKLNEKAREIKALYSDRHNMQQISELRSFVKKIPVMQQDLKSVEQFTAITELLLKVTQAPEFRDRWMMEHSILEEENVSDCVEFVRDQIDMRMPLYTALRLLCLSSITQGGYKQKEFDLFRSSLVQTYGFEMFGLLPRLEALGFLRLRKGSNPWSSLRSGLELINSEAKVEDPDDIAYTTSGYAPLSVRLVEIGMTRGWRTINEYLRILPGEVEEFNQETGIPTREEEGADRSRKTVLVCFIGGATYLELSALRHLSDKLPLDFIVLTTNMVNGTTLLESIIDPLENKLSSVDNPTPAGGAAGAAT